MRIKYETVIFVFFFIHGLIIPAFAGDIHDRTIHIADDSAEWPPYTYYKRINGKKSDEIVGFSVDVIRDIFNNNNINFTITFLPWKRALLEVENGKQYQMLLSGSYSRERDKKYYLSKGYYSTTVYYFYSKKHHPDGMVINSTSDLKKYNIAGLRGYNYESYGINNHDIYKRLNNYNSLIPFLHANRCDLFLDIIELMSGYSQIGKNYLGDKDLAYAPAEGILPAIFQMMITKNELGKELKRIIDKGINRLEKSGRLAEMKKKYLK